VGGNDLFTPGAYRTVHAGQLDLLPLVENVPAALVSRTDVEPYTAGQFTDDIMRLSGGRSDTWGGDGVEWLKRTVGVPFTLSFNRQAYEVDRRQRFWGGMALSTRDGGRDLVAAHRVVLRHAAAETWFEAHARELIRKDGAAVGVVVEGGKAPQSSRCGRRTSYWQLRVECGTATAASRRQVE